MRAELSHRLSHTFREGLRHGEGCGGGTGSGTLYSTLLCRVWDGVWDTMTAGGGIYLRTRIPAKVFTDLERLAQLQNISLYALAQKLIIQGVQALLGTAQERARIQEELAALEKTEAAALEDLASRALELRMKEAPQLPPFQAIVAAFNTGDGKGALAHFKELTPHVQNNVLHRLQKEAPEIAERLQSGE